MPGATRFSDTFTDTDGVLLPAHTCDAGGPWIDKASGSGATVAQILGNRFYYPGAASTDNRFYEPTTQPTGVEYDLEFDVVFTGSTAGQVPNLELLFRVKSTVTTGYYRLFYGCSINAWSLDRVAAAGDGGNASYGTYSDPYSGKLGGHTDHIKITVRTAKKTVYINGVERLSTTDDALATGGVRVRPRNIHTTNSQRIDNFLLSDLPIAPVNTVAPAVTGPGGTIRVGQTVSCTTGTWSNGVDTYAYQWKRNGSNIAGATSSTYLLANPDIGQSIACTVTATNEAGAVSATSNTIVPADVLPPPTNTAAPVVTMLGYATTGHVATCTTGTWSDEPDSYAYQWTRDGTNIGGATANTRTLAVADEGHAIRCAVTATNAAGTGTALSNIINAEANHSMATQTDIVYHGTATGLTGSVNVTVIKLDDASTVSARSTSAIIELTAGSGTYRARRNLDAGKYVALFDEGTFSATTVTPVPVAV